MSQKCNHCGKFTSIKDLWEYVLVEANYGNPVWRKKTICQWCIIKIGGLESFQVYFRPTYLHKLVSCHNIIEEEKAIILPQIKEKTFQFLEI